MRKFTFKTEKFTIESGVKFFYEKNITKFGNGAKIDAPKEYIGRRVIVLVCHKWALRDLNPRPLDYQSSALARLS